MGNWINYISSHSHLFLPKQLTWLLVLNSPLPSLLSAAWLKVTG
ncbi:hypothetical protein KSS87_014234 [Heliosperma pusillum]|nr:hypothetical protein KSS87_014234 [Heliosperma pusillum]